MKKSMLLFVFSVVLLLSVTNANATIRRVGYFGTPIPNTDFGDLQSAENTASAGDTLLIFPGSFSATFFKRLVVIGYGYFLTGAGADSSLQVISGSVSIGVTLANGCDSSVFQGLSNLSLTVPNFYGANITGIVVNRCLVNLSLNLTNDNITLNYLKISQSYINSFSIGGTGSTIIFKNVSIENNIVNSLNFGFALSSSTGVLNNNILISAPSLNNGAFSIANNIFLSTSAPSNTTNSTFYNNIASNNTIPYGNNNQPNVNLSTVFVGYPTQGTYSNDGRYTLAAGSPAIGTGENGIDCGIFGGIHPYHLAGIPPIPSFYKLTASSNITSGNPYTITFSVRSNN